jgi:hypothetical protein
MRSRPMTKQIVQLLAPGRALELLRSGTRGLLAVALVALAVETVVARSGSGAAVDRAGGAAEVAASGATAASEAAAAAVAADRPNALRRAVLVDVPSAGTLAASLASFAGGSDQAVWVGWSVPQVAGSGFSCCTSGDGQRETLRHGCTLDLRGGVSLTATEDRPSPPATSDRLEIFVRLERGAIGELRLVSAGCPVDAGGQRVGWLAGVAPGESVRLLAALPEPGTAKPRTAGPVVVSSRVADEALAAVALHAEAEADRVLAELARGGSRRREEAWFWLGQARGDAGYRVLRELVTELPAKDREELTFGLSRSPIPAAQAQLRRLVSADPSGEVRARAMFWLAQAGDAEGVAAIRAALRGDRDPEVREQAVFALSQLPGGRGADEMLALIDDRSLDAEVRQKAVFWLAQSDDPRADEVIERLLAN